MFTRETNNKLNFKTLSKLHEYNFVFLPPVPFSELATQNCAGNKPNKYLYAQSYQ